MVESLIPHYATSWAIPAVSLVAAAVRHTHTRDSSMPLSQLALQRGATSSCHVTALAGDETGEKNRSHHSIAISSESLSHICCLASYRPAILLGLAVTRYLLA
jgi:hypothetical protein